MDKGCSAIGALAKSCVIHTLYIYAVYGIYLHVPTLSTQQIGLDSKVPRYSTLDNVRRGILPRFSPKIPLSSQLHSYRTGYPRKASSKADLSRAAPDPSMPLIS